MDFFDISMKRASLVEDELTRYVLNQAPQDYLTKVSGPWINLYKDGYDDLSIDGGFKIHLSTMAWKWKCQYDVISSVLFNEGVSFKVAKSISVLKVLNNPHALVEEANKFITVYPKNTFDFKRIIFRLVDALKGVDAPVIPMDWQCRKAQSVHFRYGAFKKHVIWNEKTGLPRFYYINDQGCKLEDVRSEYQYLPAKVELPFSRQEQEDLGLVLKDINPENHFFDYEFESIIQERNKGAVYKALRKSDGLSVIIKTANSHIKLDKSGLSAKKALANEAEMLNKLGGKSLSPVLIETFMVQSQMFLVETAINGVSINKPVEPVLRNTVIEALINTCGQIHEIGVFIGDLSNNNFVFDGQKCLLIDLEDCGLLNHFALNGQTEAYRADWIDAHDGLKIDQYAQIICCLTIMFGRPPRFQDTANAVTLKIKIQKYLKFARDSGFVNGQNSKKICTLINNCFGECSEIQRSSINSPERNINRLENSIEFIGNHLKDAPQNNRYWISNMFGMDRSPWSIQHGVSGVFDALINTNLLKKNEINDILNKVATELGKFEFDNEGLLFGKAGYLWMLVDVYKRTKSSEALKLIESVLATLKKPFDLKCDDFALGKAGILYTLVFLKIDNQISISDQTINEYLDAVIIAGKREVLKLKMLPASHLSEIGMAHGLSGLALALAVAGVGSNNNEAINISEQLFDEIIKATAKFIDSTNHNEYMDLSWCKGLSGIESAILMAVDLGMVNSQDELLKKINSRMEKGFMSLESNLCHGKDSILNTLMDFCEFNDSNCEKIKKDIPKLIDLELLETKASSKQLIFWDETGYDHIEDFGVGQCGSIYTLLRYFKGLKHLFQFSKEDLKHLKILQLKIIAQS